MTELLVAGGIVLADGREFFTRWVTRSEWEAARKEVPEYPYTEPNLEQRKPNEIQCETDYPKRETNFEVMSHAHELLKKQNISHEFLDCGNKSFYIMIPMNREMTKPMILAYLNTILPDAIVNDLDDANFSLKRMVGRIGQPHRKSGKPKVVLESFHPEKLNIFPENLLAQIQAEEARRAQFSNLPRKKFEGHCAVCETALEVSFTAGQNRNAHLVPNLVAYLPPEKWEQAARTQGKTLREFQGWAERTPAPQFNCLQLQDFAKKNGLEELCKACPYRIVKLSLEQKHDVNLIRSARRF